MIDLKAPVSTIMSTDLIMVSPDDKLKVVQQLFNDHHIHHVPVVRFKSLVGIVSKSDLLHFYRGMHQNTYDARLEESRLRNYTAQDIMTTGIAKLEPSDRIEVAVEVFKENLFHAIPIVDDNELVGILTTFDLIAALSQ